jgi:hypothetical protein
MDGTGMKQKEHRFTGLMDFFSFLRIRMRVFMTVFFKFSTEMTK